MPFTHLSPDGRPRMVDVGDKSPTRREAAAEATVVLGPDVYGELAAKDFNGKKGAVLQTAIIAGTMAVKQTWATIPLCHAIPISGCTVSIAPQEAEHALKITCTVRTEGKTGVEMEALHGATVAGLTIYDMCKALSHAIRIENVHLVAKSGGKNDYRGG